MQVSPRSELRQVLVISASVVAPPGAALATLGEAPLRDRPVTARHAVEPDTRDMPIHLLSTVITTL